MCVSCIPKPAAFLVITRGKGKKEDGGTLDKKKIGREISN
jgi:hypothetical protein